MREIRLLGLLLFMVTALVGWNRSSLDAGLPDANLLRYPYLQQVTTSSAIIVWTTAEDGLSVVRYGTEGLQESSVPATSALFVEPSVPDQEPRSYYVHVAGLTDLLPGTRYLYTVETGDVELAPGDELSFRTDRGADGSTLRLLVFGDSGTGGLAQLRLRVEMMAQAFDVGIHTGDLAYPSGTYGQLEEYFLAIYGGLVSRMAIFPSLGNHDYKTLGAQPYLDGFRLPENATSEAHLERYYSFDYGPAHFVALDTEIWAGYQGGASAAEEMAAWLEEDLASTDQDWTFVYFHRPAYSSSNIPESLDLQRVLPVIEQANVDIVFTGHDHIYARTLPIKEGAPEVIGEGGIVHVTTGGGGGGKHFCEPRSYTAICLREFHFLDVQITDACRLAFDVVGFGAAVHDHFELDRCDPDSDTDGLTDSAELGIHGTDPLNPDSDGDTFSDSAEVDFGSDPLGPDSRPLVPSPTPTPTSVPLVNVPSGDANCDGMVNSIDASLVLQFSAGLLGALGCDDAADANGDGSLNSIDAALILQFTAGLVDRLSP